MKWRRLALAVLTAAWVGVTVWHTVKALPPGTHLASRVCSVPQQELAFVADITAADAYGRPVVSQGIFDEVLRVVGAARRFIVLDYTRFGSERERAPQRRLASELTDALLARQRALPQLKVLFITDPANDAYGAGAAEELQVLRAAGIEVVPVDLDVLRDSNLLYSGLWRLALQWWDGPRGSFGAAARRLNFKADGRKLILADDGASGLTAVLGSANPQDAQSAWSNLAARVHGAALAELLRSELEVAHFSGWRGSDADFGAATEPAACADAAPDAQHARVQLLTEGAIRAALLEHLASTTRGDAIEVAAFHLGDRGVLESLLDAARRGVNVRLILDPNEDAAGGAGLPNQPLAGELVSRSSGAIRVRWYRTHGERFHSALVLVTGGGRLWLTLGSAALTRRSLGDYNLEANLGLELQASAALAQQARGYFDTLWDNKAALGIEYTADYEAFANPSQADYWLCRLLEGVGAAPF